MKNIVAGISSALILISSGMLFGRAEECRKKCDEDFTQCRNHCMVMAADNTGCEERCAKERDRCAGACGSVRPDSNDPDEWDNEDLGDDDFNDLEDLDDRDDHFDGVDEMLDGGVDKGD